MQTGWITAGEGLLVMAPANGMTVTAANMLGAYSGNGFADLAALDSNGDGVINASDAAYAQLRVWVSTNASAGTLYTLAQLGITSISVNAQTSGKIDNGNTIVATSTFTINGATNTIAEVNFAANQQITQLQTSNVSPSPTALNLPNLTGFGFLPDLNVAVTTDPTLEKMVYNLVFNSATMSSAQFNSAFQNMLYEWAGATNIRPTAYGDHINGQHLAVIYAYLGINPATNPQYAGWEPNWHNGPSVWEPTYQQILQFYEIAFISQISQSLTNFGVDPTIADANPYSAFVALGYAPTTNQLYGNTSSLPSITTALAPADPAAAATYWAQVQGAIQALDYVQGDTGVDAGILLQLTQSATEAQTLAAIEAMNTIAPIFTISSGTGYTNISGDGASVTYAGTGSVEIPAAYSGYVLVPAGCTQLTLDGNGTATIVLQDAKGPSDVTFSVSGTTLVATFAGGSSLALIGQATNITTQVTTNTFLFNNGTAIPQTEILSDLVATEAASGSQTIQGFALGGTLVGAAGNDVLIAASNPISGSTTSNAASAGIGMTIFDVGTGNDVLVTSFVFGPPTSGVSDVINWNSGDGSELVYTAVNHDYLPHASSTYFTDEAAYMNNLLNQIPGLSFPSLYVDTVQQISQNTISFGAGISAADITISAVGSWAQSNTIEGIFTSDPTTSSYIYSSYVNGTTLNPWSMTVTIDGGKTITFTGGADTLQAIDFADGTVMTAQAIGNAYVASEEAQNLTFIQGTELGNTLKGTSGKQVLFGFSGNDTLIAGPGNDTLIAGAGVNTYEVNAGSGDAVIINNRPSGPGSYAVGSGQSEMDDTLVLGAGIDPSQLTVTAVASLDVNASGLPDILLTIAGSGQTIRLTDQNQTLAGFDPTTLGNNGAAVGQIRFADGTVWSAADILGKLANAANAALSAAHPGYTVINGTSGNDTLQSGATPELLAGGLGSDTYLVNAGDAATVIVCGVNGSGGGTLDHFDNNVLRFGAGISASDITVTQAANGNDLVLTVGATGQTVTLANQLTGDARAIISQVQFADGTVLSNAQLFNASVAGSLAAGATVIYGSVSVNSGSADTFIPSQGLNAGDASVTLVGRGSDVAFYLGAGAETVVVDSAVADIVVAPGKSNDTIDLTSTATTSNFYANLFFEGAQPTGATWSANVRDLILTFAGTNQTLTLDNFNYQSDLRIASYDPATSTFSNWASLGNLNANLASVSASSGQSTFEVDNNGLTIDPAGNAATVNLNGNNDTIIYRPGYGAMTINVADNGQYPSNVLELIGTSSDPLTIPTQSGPTGYSVDSAGDLTLNFGNGDVVTIDHEFNVDGTISANGIQRVYNSANSWNSLNLTGIGYASRHISASVGQTSLSGGGEGGIFDTAGIATAISDSGYNTDAIVYNRGYGAINIGELSNNSNNTIEFGAGITLASLSFSADAQGDIIISLGNGDQITLVNALSTSLGFVQAVGYSGVFGVSNLLFQDGSSATISAGWDTTGTNPTGTVLGSDGSSVTVDTSSFLIGGTLASGSGPAIFNPGGKYSEIAGTGEADVINYNGGEGALAIDEAAAAGVATARLDINDYGISIAGGQGSGSGGGGLPVADAVMEFATSYSSSYGGAYGGGSSSSTPDLGSIVGVTESATGDITLYLGNGDNITLQGQLAPGGTMGVAEIDISASGGTYGWGGSDAWTNADIKAALAYEATTGIVPNDPTALILTTSGVNDGSVTEQAGVPNGTDTDTAAGVLLFADGSTLPADTLTVQGVTVSGTTNGAPDTVALLAMLSLGTITEPAGNSDGSASWAFTAPIGTFAYLSAGEEITLTYNVGIANATGGYATTDVTVTVTGTNQAPVIAVTGTSANAALVDQATATNAATLDSASGVIAFTDANRDDAHTATITGVTASIQNASMPSTTSLLSLLSLGPVSEPAGATPGTVDWTFAAPNGDFAWLANGQSLTLDYTVEVADDVGAATTQNVVVTITGANDVPVIVVTATTATGAITEQASAAVAPTTSGSLTFADPDSTDTHSAVITGVAATGSTANLPDTSSLLSLLALGNLTEAVGAQPGSVNWTFSDRNATFALLPMGETITLTYAVQITNSEGGTVTQDVAINVTGTYDAPVIAPATTTSTAVFAAQGTSARAGTTDAASGSIAFTDADTTATHTASLVSVFATGTTTSSTPSTVDFTTGVIPYLPSNATLLSMLTLGNLADTAGSTPGTLAWNFSAPDGDFNYLSAGETVTLNYVINIANSDGGQASQIVTLTVTGTNDAPVIVGQAGGTIYEQAAPAPDSALNRIQFQNISFTDANLDDTHTATVTGVNAAGDTSGIPSSDALLAMLSLGTPNETYGTGADYVGWGFTATNGDFAYLGQGQSVTLTYSVQIADNHGGVATQDVVITVLGADDVPVIVAGSTTAFGAFTDQSDPASANTVQTASGSIAFTDAYLADTHTASVTNVHASGDTSGLPDYQTLVSLLSLGTLVEQSNGNPGSIAWDFAAPNGDFAGVGLGQTVTLDYTIQIANNTGGTTTQDVSVTITGTRDKPVIVPSATTASAAITDLSASSVAAAVQTAAGVIAFSDPDTTLTHTVSVIGVSTGGNTNGAPSNATLLSLLSLGSVAEEASGVPGTIAWNFAMPNGDFAYLDQGQTLSLSYTVEVANSTGGTTTQNVVINIAGTNDVPQIVSGSTTASASVPELLDVSSSALDTATGSIAFSDASLATSHTAKVVSVNADSSLLPLLTLSAVSEASGTTPGSVGWNFAIPNGAYSWLPQGQTATLNYVVEITNNLGETVDQNVSITIVGAKDIPAIYQALTTATATLTELPAPATSTTLDTASGSIAFADTHLEFTHTASVVSGIVVGDVLYARSASTGGGGGAPALLWSEATILSWFSLGNLSEAANSTSGAVGWNFAVPNGTFAYLSDGESVTLTYVVQIANGTGGTVDQPVVITVTGTEFAPVIVPSVTSATGAITELAVGASASAAQTATGTIAFTDTNLDDTHTVGISGVTATGATAGLPANANLLSLLSLGAPVEETGTNPGTVSWSFADPNGVFAYLTAGQTVTLTYAVQVADNHGGAVTQNVAVTITGTGHAAPVLSILPSATTAIGAITEQGTPGVSTLDTASGVIAFSDTALTDTHTASITGVTASGATSGLPSNSTLLAMLALGTITEQAGSAPGTLGWSFATPDADFNYLSAGETVTLTYTVALADTSGTITDQNVTVTITGTNYAPTIVTTATTASAAITAQGAPGITTPDTASGSIAFLDANLDDTHTASVAGVTVSGVTGGLPPQATLLGLLSLGTLTEDPVETPGCVGWTFSAPDAAFNYLSAGEKVTLTYAVEIADHNGGSATQNVTVTVTGTNEAPTIVATATSATGAITAQGTAGLTAPDTASGSIGFADANRDDTHTASITGVSTSGVTSGLPATAALLSMLSLGALSEDAGAAPGSVGWSFSAPDADFNYLSAGESVALTYTAAITDNHGGVTTQNVTVTITGTNEAPVILTGATTATGAINETWNAPTSWALNSASGTITFSDANLDDTHSAAIVGVTASGAVGGLPSSAALVALLSLGSVAQSPGSTSGSLGWNFAAPNSDFAYLSVGETVTLNYAVQIADNHGGSVTQNVVITVTGGNAAPTIVPTVTTATASITELPNTTGSSTPDTAQGSIGFIDPNLDDKHTAYIAGVSVAGSATSGLPVSSTLLTYLTLGGISEEAGSTPGALNWAFAAPDSTFDYLAANELVQLVYTIGINDGFSSTIQNIIVTIHGSDDAPVITAPGAQVARTGVVTSLSGIVITDPDDGATESVTLSDTLGKLAATASGGAAVTGSASKSLTISGTLAAVNSTLATLTYTASSAGYDTITVTANDGTLASSATVAETISSTADHNPVVLASSTLTGAITELSGVTGSTTNDTASGTLSFTDADAGDTHTLTVQNVNWTGNTSGLPTASTVLGWLKAGTITNPSGTTPGSAAWSFAAADKYFDYLAAGQTLTLTYAVQLSDNHSGYTTQNITITVTGSNDAPVITSSTSSSVTIASQGSPTAWDASFGTIYFTDPEQADTHTISSIAVAMTGTTTGLAGIATGTILSWLQFGSVNEESGSIAGSDSMNFSATDNYFAYLSVGQSVTLTYTVQVADNHGGTATRNYAVTVTGTNDAPSYVASGSSLTGAITELANTTNSTVKDTTSGVMAFIDPNLADTHTVSVVSVSGSGDTSGLPAWATVLTWLKAGSVTEETTSTAGSTTWTFAAADASFDYLSAGDALTLTYTLQVADNHGGSFQQNVAVTITGTNDTPTIAAGTSTAATLTRSAVNPNDMSSIDAYWGVMRFTDPEQTDTHTVSVTGVSLSGTTKGLSALGIGTILSWLQIGSVNEESGTVAASAGLNFAAADGYFSYLSAGQSVTMTYTVQVTDEHGASATQTFAVTANGVNYAPTAINHTGYTTDNWTALNITAASLIVGATDPNLGDTLTLSSVSGAVGGTVALVSGNAVFTPTATAIGPASFTYTIADGHGGTSSATANLTTTLHDIVGTAGGSISGGSKQAQLDGSAGNETVTAGSVGDILIGGAGDTLVGGAGADTFVFHSGFGHETITSFTATGTKHDTLQFDTSVFADWAHLLGATKQQGSDLRITLDANDTLLVKNVALANFTSADAKFV